LLGNDGCAHRVLPRVKDIHDLHAMSTLKNASQTIKIS
jgi:hypothetical protein